MEMFNFQPMEDSEVNPPSFQYLGNINPNPSVSTSNAKSTSLLPQREQEELNITQALSMMGIDKVKNLIEAAKQTLEQKETKERIKDLLKTPNLFVTDPYNKQYVFILGFKDDAIGIVALPFDKKKNLLSDPSFKVEIQYYTQEQTLEILEGIKVRILDTLITPIENFQDMVISLKSGETNEDITEAEPILEQNLNNLLDDEENFDD